MSNILEEAKFIQHHLPGLEAGTYMLSVNNKISAMQGTPPTQVNYKFGVKGPRYSLSPDVVHSVFPPANSSGAFDNAVPHIVFNKKTLPWIRTPQSSPPSFGKFTATAVNADGNPIEYDTDQPSWLAVLLINTNDFNYDGVPSGIDGKPLTLNTAIQSGTVANLFPADGDTFVSNLSLSGITPATLDIGESTTDLCRCLQLPLEVFNFIAPSLNDLAMMANVRQVNIANKPDGLSTKVLLQELKNEGQATDNQALGTYSIVMGNRLPAPNQKNIAVLVSLEGLQEYLPSDSGVASTTQLPEGTTIIRLPVLKSWSFTSNANKYNFVALFEELNGGVTSSGSAFNSENGYFKYYPTDSEDTGLNSYTQTALAQGYIPIKHLLRQGSQTASWYRGPLAPFDIASTVTLTPTVNGKQSLIQHPDSLLRLNPDTGFFDVSYAAAWQLGQLLALQDKSFSTLLFRWKRATLLSLIQEIDEHILYSLLPSNTIVDLKSAANTGETDDQLNMGFYEGVLNLLSKIPSGRKSL